MGHFFGLRWQAQRDTASLATFALASKLSGTLNRSTFYVAKLTKEKRCGATLPTLQKRGPIAFLHATVLAISSAKLRRGKVMLRNAFVLSVAKRKLGKFFRM